MVARKRATIQQLLRVSPVGAVCESYGGRGVEVEELLHAAEAAEAEARAMLPTAAEERAIIDAAEELAGGEAGVPAKSRAVVLVLETKWLHFLERQIKAHALRLGLASIAHAHAWLCISSI